MGWKTVLDDLREDIIGLMQDSTSAGWTQALGVFPPGSVIRGTKTPTWYATKGEYPCAQVNAYSDDLDPGGSNKRHHVFPVEIMLFVKGDDPDSGLSQVEELLGAIHDLLQANVHLPRGGQMEGSGKMVWGQTDISTSAVIFGGLARFPYLAYF